MKYIALIILLTSFNIKSQTKYLPCYCINDTKDEINKYYSTGFLYSKINYKKINNLLECNIIRDTSILFTDFYNLGGSSDCNSYLDVILDLGAFQYVNKNLYSELVSFKLFIYDSLTKKFKLSKKVDSIIKLAKTNYDYFIAKSTFIFSQNDYISNNMQDFEISCTYHPKLIRMIYDYIDLDYTIMLRVPLMIDCNEYKKYNDCIYKKYNLKKPKLEEYIGIGYYEKNYTFKEVTMDLLIDIIQIEILDKKGNFIKVYPFE